MALDGRNLLLALAHVAAALALGLDFVTVFNDLLLHFLFADEECCKVSQEESLLRVHVFESVGALSVLFQVE